MGKLIDTESLLDDLYDLQTYKLFSGQREKYVDVQNVCDLINNALEVKLPPIRKAHWTEEHTCSDCRNHSIHVTYKDGMETWVETAYCPFCGAWMYGG